ncbi:C1 family peptidase [Bombilactobacillus thymidiniphilus]|uniref:Aminopeptidase n=1 Tax=Bombilactobacillus thymidiniphilus TaxID=2923363 RepID=A0ABY4PDU9_9LACO|nr:C1 family peptidase [Bombilactobacillus thymidiniphilus]UQS83953.1 C1 family peptidase [Bombilactobacillus thymidiniphilus]
MTQAIKATDLAKFQADLAQVPAANTIQNSVTTNGIYKASETLAAKVAMDPTFSIDLTTGKVADQQRSGLCWVFAALNTLRHPMQAKFKIKDFELSQGYMFFWDKLEKSNYFYENVINTADLKIGDRKVDFLMTTPQQDGGQWDMVCALFEKYGVVPKSVMPDTASRSNSSELNQVLNTKLRKDAVQLRKWCAEGMPATEIADRKEKMLSEIYRILTYALGQPPVQFDWSYRDDNNEFHSEKNITPQEFYKKYIDLNLPDYLSVINAPTTDKPYNHVYTVELLGNVVDGRPVRHLNLDLDTFKQSAIKQLQSGEAIWFGSDVSQMSDRQLGILDTNIYDLNGLFGIDLEMTKAQRLDYAESMMNHAMVLTGVDLDENGKATKWKVENSWGEKVGTKGYFVMSDAWFDQFVYQLVIQRKYLPETAQKVYDQEKDTPKVLAPWDPMGALA